MALRRLPPNLIKLETHKLLSSTINLNNVLCELLNTPEYNTIFNELIKKINFEFDKVKTANPETIYEYLLMGSKSWNIFFKDFYDLNILSPYEKSSIHNTTGDLMYFINNKNLVDDIYKTIKNLLKDEIEPIVDAIKIYLDIDDKLKNVYITIEEKQCINGKNTLLPSKQLFVKLHINDSVPQPKIRKPQTQADAKKDAQVAATKAQSKIQRSEQLKATRKQNKEELERQQKAAQEKEAIAKSQSISNRALRSANRESKKGGTIIEPFNKIIISVNLYYSENSTITEDTLLVRNISKLVQRNDGLHYLNLAGLYIFLQLGKKKIFIPKGYNILKIREIIFDKIVLINDYKTPTLKMIADQYYETFNGTSVFDKLFHDDLSKLYALSYEPIGIIINNMEIEIIETLRRYINKTMKNINDKIQEINNNIGLFVVGGDALRRYKNDISVTKDIDCKIYIPQSLSSDDLIKETTNVIIEELLILVCYLIENTDNIFKDVECNHENELYKITYILSNGKDNDEKNFKYRQLFKNPFPVDLFSLDYRCIINVEVKDNKLNPSMNTKFSYNYDIAFLDVVLQSIEVSGDANDFYKSIAVLSNDIPISTLEFLLNDLKNTYNNDDSSLLRFIGGKIRKDFNRYNEVVKLLNKKIFKYSDEGEELLKEKLQSADDDNLYILRYRPIEEDEEATEIKLPVLFETSKTNVDELFYARGQLDLIYDFEQPTEKFYNFYKNCYEHSINRRKIDYGFNIKTLEEKSRQRLGGTKSPFKFAKSSKLQELEKEDLDEIKELEEKYIYNDNQEEIEKEEIEELEHDYINNIMVSKYKDLQEPKKDILRNFYENIDTNIDTTFYENIKKTILNKFDENIILSKAKKSKSKKIYDFIINSKKIN
jgi:hypothetical protein